MDTKKLRDTTMYLYFDGGSRFFSKPLLLMYLILILATIGFFSCQKEKDYNLRYKIYYPNNIVNKTNRCSCVDVRLISVEGTNDLICRKGFVGVWIESTTAPIELISLH